MKYLHAFFLILCTELAAQADLPQLKEARQRLLHGNYEEAGELYAKQLGDKKWGAAAAIGLSRALASQGKHDESLAAIEAALVREPKNADLLALKAEGLYDHGKWLEAEKAAADALAIKADHLRAHWVQARLYWDRGDLPRADAAFRWFVKTYTDRSEHDQDIKDPDDLLLVGLAATEYSRWHSLSDQFQVILDDVYGEALKIEPEFWPASYQAGMLYLEKFDRGNALDYLDKALTVNPNAPEVLAAKGEVALQRFEIKDADDFAVRALRINPHLPEALRLRADIHLVSGETKLASESAQRARKVNPRDERTLARVAIGFVLAHDDKGLGALEQEILHFNPKPGVFYLELAQRLEERKLYEQAEMFYRQAIAARPMLPAGRNGMGLLFMRLGREKEARDLLTAGFKADEFNVRVANSLKVLRHLDKYETVITDHFVVRFDPQIDALLARFLTDYLEALYAELAKEFQYHPPGPVLIEIFNNHDMFSGRIIALPDLHTIGASSGRMVAMLSPYSKKLPQPFNWARVIRHELVHIFNLEQTHFQSPHWFTEGLAVINEGFPRPPQWNALLKQRVPAGDALTLDTIELAFIRPRTPLDWHMAYCQSQLYIQFMRERYGPKTVSEMLAAYRDGLDTTAAIRKVCGVDKNEFEKGYREYLDGVVRSLSGRASEKPLSFNELQKIHEDKPNEVEVSAKLAEQYLLRRDKKEARKLAEEVLGREKTHPLASYVKAKLLMDSGDEDQAKQLLEASVADAREVDLKVAQMLGHIYYESKDFVKAASLYERARSLDPYEVKWLVELNRVYTQLGDKAKQRDICRELAANDGDNLEIRKQLALALAEEGRYQEAERYARQALEIDIRDAEMQECLLKSLRKQNKVEEADRLGKLFGS